MKERILLVLIVFANMALSMAPRIIILGLSLWVWLFVLEGQFKHLATLNILLWLWFQPHRHAMDIKEFVVSKLK